VERAKPQAATKFLSHAGENVSRKSRKPAQLKAFSFKDYQLITKLISRPIMDNILLLNVILRTCIRSDTDHSVPLESMFSTAGYILSSKRSPVAPYKVDMLLFIHDNYDVVC